MSISVAQLEGAASRLRGAGSAVTLELIARVLRADLRKVASYVTRCADLIEIPELGLPKAQVKRAPAESAEVYQKRKELFEELVRECERDQKKISKKEIALRMEVSHVTLYHCLKKNPEFAELLQPILQR